MNEDKPADETVLIGICPFYHLKMFYYRLRNVSNELQLLLPQTLPRIPVQD